MPCLLGILAAPGRKLGHFGSIAEVNQGVFPFGRVALLIASHAQVAELADAPVLGTGTVRCGGSSPSLRTQQKTLTKCTSSPDEGGDAVRTRDTPGESVGDDWSRERTRARVVQGLKEMVVALVEVGDFEGAQRIALCLHDLAGEDLLRPIVEPKPCCAAEHFKLQSVNLRAASFS